MSTRVQFFGRFVLSLLSPLVFFAINVSSRNVVASASFVELPTGEAKEISVKLGNGLSPTIGWTVLDPDKGGVTMTLAIKSTSMGWLALGVSSTSGLGCSLMYGGLGGGAIIWRKEANDVQTIKEYSLLGPSPRDVIAYDSGPVSVADIRKCVTDFCLKESQECFKQSLCANAISCGEAQFNALPMANSSTPEAFFNSVNQCASPLSNPRDPNQVLALSALLDAGGCVVSACLKRVIDKGHKESSLNSSSITQVGAVTVLRFSLKDMQIAGIAFDPRSTTFLIAMGPSLSDHSFVAHGPDARTFAVVNLENGQSERSGPPDWLVWHIALCSIAYVVLFPLSICLRGLALRHRTWLHMLVSFAAMGFAGTGSIIVWTVIARPDLGNPHAVVGIIALVFLFAYFLFYVVQPVEHGERDKAWNKLSGLGIGSETAAEQEEIHAFSGLVRYGFMICEVLSAGLAIAALFTGLPAMEDSIVRVEPVYTGLAITSALLFFVAIAFTWIPQLNSRINRVLRIAGGPVETESVEFEVQSSANPSFEGAHVPSSSSSSVEPWTLSWEHVAVKIKVRGTAALKVLVENASGYCPPGTVTAVLGPSGAGKSTLIQVLALRKVDSAVVDGAVHVNGRKPSRADRAHNKIGFVSQEDVLHEYLTVAETLRFACQMMMPSTGGSAHSNVDRVIRLVEQLGLTQALHTRVGGGLSSKGGCSGGERRRVSIALQLLKSPSVLILDEPTSGLDAHLALQLIKVLKQLAAEGRTVVATIHQPSIACYENFDRVVLLAGGRTVYSGPRADVEGFLTHVQRTIPEAWNPADWLLHMVDYERDWKKRVSQLDDTPDSEPTKAQAVREDSILDLAQLRVDLQHHVQDAQPNLAHREVLLKVEELVAVASNKGLPALRIRLAKPFTTHATLRRSGIALEKGDFEDVLELISAFESSMYASALAKSIQTSTIGGEVPSPSDSTLTSDGGYAQSFLNQTRLLTRRSLALAWRNPQALRFQALQNVLFGVLLGALYSNVQFLRSSPFQQSIVMAIILAMVAFVTLSLGTQVAFRDRLVLEREMSDALYSPLAHFMQRMVVGVPLGFVVALCLILPAYFWVGLDPEPNAFVFFCLVNLVLVFLFDSVVFALTLIVRSVNTAYALGNFYEALAIFFSGVFLPLYAMPIYFRWLYFLSPFAYAFGAVVVNEFAGTDKQFTIAVTGVAINNEWINLIILLAMAVTWRLVGLLGVVRLFMQKRPGLY